MLLPHAARAALGGLVAASLLVPVSAQSRFATSVVSFHPGSGAGSDTARLLGGPQGGGWINGSLDVLTLGVGGDVTLGFDVVLRDGPGADFTVYENGFVAGGGVFSEVVFVEVSTNGVDFARFTADYEGPVGPLPAFGAVAMGSYAGLAGGLPGFANVATNAIDPFDPVASGGEALDLAELAGHPLVVGGLLDLQDVRYVRLVDVVAGTVADVDGDLVQDHGGATGSADLDAVAVIQHTGNVEPSGPTVDLFVDGAGHLNLILEDPDGFADIDQSTLRVSFNYVPTAITRLRGLLPDITFTAEGLRMRSLAPIAGSGVKGVLAVSTRDQAGAFSGDQVAVQG